jgi:hypothetical protein
LSKSIYGRYQFDDEVDELIGRISNVETKRLRAIGLKSAEDAGPIRAWLDTYRMTEHREAALVYFLLGVIARLED